MSILSWSHSMLSPVFLWLYIVGTEYGHLLRSVSIGWFDSLCLLPSQYNIAFRVQAPNVQLLFTDNIFFGHVKDKLSNQRTDCQRDTLISQIYLCREI